VRALLFHNVVDQATDPFDRALERMHVNAFRRELTALCERYRLVSHDEALAIAAAGGDPGAMTITFDDGFAGVKDVALPVLAEFGATAAVFVLTEPGGVMRADRLLHFESLEIAFRLAAASSLDLAWCGEGVVALDSDTTRVRVLRAVKRWLKTRPDDERMARQAALHDQLGVPPEAISEYARRFSKFRKLTLEDCRALVAAGWTIGGHTRHHPSLRQCDDERVADEIFGNAHDLAALNFINIPFAFPYGGDDNVDARARGAAKAAGFRCAWTTVPGDNVATTNTFALRRFSVLGLHHAARTNEQTPLNRSQTT
jgi:peptidoglycan/xylan/chitin deacetylase (PgdA/CDA1 family)